MFAPLHKKASLSSQGDFQVISLDDPSRYLDSINVLGSKNEAEMGVDFGDEN